MSKNPLLQKSLGRLIYLGRAKFLVAGVCGRLPEIDPEFSFEC
jgi:hypothetical protein